MANPVIQYFKDTRSELNHVAWPTQKQTVVFTVLVAAISLGIAAYVGALDYAFTSTLTRAVDISGNSSALQVTQQPVASTSAQTSTQAPAVTGPSFSIPGATQTPTPTQ